MKHLREYNTYNTTKTEELSDYLQELFDKYSIPYKEYENENSIDLYYIIQKNTILFEDQSESDYILILNIPSSIWDDMKSEMKRIKPNIELRLRSEIGIVYDEYYIDDEESIHESIHIYIK